MSFIAYNYSQVYTNQLTYISIHKNTIQILLNLRNQSFNHYKLYNSWLKKSKPVFNGITPVLTFVTSFSYKIKECNITLSTTYAESNRSKLYLGTVTPVTTTLLHKQVLSQWFTLMTSAHVSRLHSNVFIKQLFTFTDLIFLQKIFKHFISTFYNKNYTNDILSKFSHNLLHL